MSTDENGREHTEAGTPAGGRYTGKRRSESTSTTLSSPDPATSVFVAGLLTGAHAGTAQTTPSHYGYDY